MEELRKNGYGNESAIEIFPLSAKTGEGIAILQVGSKARSATAL
jgi:hypothetical protein